VTWRLQTTSGVASGLTGAVDNLVGTSNQDDGQVFNNAGGDHRFAVTGFDSAIHQIRFLLPTISLTSTSLIKSSDRPPHEWLHRTEFS
jgi:hypothetical protein